MGNDPIAAQSAQQSVRDAKERAKAAGQKLEDESLRGREVGDKFYNSLALFSGGTIALSVTYLGYLKNVPGRSVLYPKVLLASWIVLLVCVIASVFTVLLNSYYAHFARLRIYAERRKEAYETVVEEIDNLPIVNAMTQEKEEKKRRFADKVIMGGKDAEWAKRRESIYSALWLACGWVARLAFPVGLGLLMLFAAKNM